MTPSEENGASPALEAGELHAETEQEHAPVHISLSAEKLFSLGGFPVTNSIVMSVIAFVLLAGGAWVLKRKIKLIPGMFQNIMEVVFEGVLSLMDSVLGSRSKSEKYLPLVATIFFFVLISNWLGLLPGVGSIVLHSEHGATPLLRPPSSDLNFTLALAILAVVIVNIFAVIALGIRAHAKKFFTLSNPIYTFVGLLEFISEFAKIVSFSFRLFGNVFAGEVLLTIVAFLAPYFIPLPFLMLEVFVGFIQAFVFAMLALVFVAIATVEHAEVH